VEWHVEPGTFRPLARAEGGRVHWVVCDHLGTPRELFDESGGLAWAASHHVWGEIRTLWRRAANDDRPAMALAASAEAEAPYSARDASFCPIRFQGQWADPETGLCYNRFRHYDPLVGQYASPDPIGLLGGTRPQGYVENPNAWVDPLGLTEKLWKPKEVNGRRVYQRDDLIDPQKVDDVGRTNLQRMQAGRAPIGPDGQPINLHHLTQSEPGSLAEVQQSMDQQYTKILHMPDQYSFRNDPALNRSFESYKRNYWRSRANDFLE